MNPGRSASSLERSTRSKCQVPVHQRRILEWIRFAHRQRKPDHWRYVIAGSDDQRRYQNIYHSSSHSRPSLRLAVAGVLPRRNNRSKRRSEASKSLRFELLLLLMLMLLMVWRFDWMGGNWNGLEIWFDSGFLTSPAQFDTHFNHSTIHHDSLDCLVISIQVSLI